LHNNEISRERESVDNVLFALEWSAKFVYKCHSLIDCFVNPQQNDAVAAGLKFFQVLHAIHQSNF